MQKNYELKIHKIYHRYYPELIIDTRQKITKGAAAMINRFIDNWSPCKVFINETHSTLIPLEISYEE